jgi:integrase
MARARVAGVWVLKQRLSRDWRLGHLDELELLALEAKQAHDSGRKIIERVEMPTVLDLGEDWLADLRHLVAAGDYSPKTLEAYGSAWNAHIKPDLGNYRLAGLTVPVLLKWRAGKQAKHSRAHVDFLLAALSALLSRAVPRHLDFNPVVAMRMQTPRSRRVRSAPPRSRAMAIEFAQALLASTDGVLHDMILCGLTTGMRQAELAGLRAGCLSPASSRILVDNQLIDAEDHPPKWGQVRDTLYCESLQRRLQLRLEHVTDYVFVNPVTGQPWRDRAMTLRFNKAWEAIGERPKRDSWHVLRHTFATVLDQHRIRPLVIDLLMGHAKEGVAGRYRHVLDDEYDLALEVIESTFGYPAIGVGGQQPEGALQSR